MKYMTQATITIPNTETKEALYFGTSNPWGEASGPLGYVGVYEVRSLQCS